MIFIFTSWVVALAPLAEVGTSTLAVHVTASRVAASSARAARATDTIDREAIERSGARDLADLLATQGGADVQRTFRGASVRLSGLDPEHVLLLVDGVPVIGRIDGAIDLSRLPLADVERVEIVRGASSALHGADAMAGVIEVTTRKAKSGAEVEVVGRSMPGLDARGRVSWAGERASAKLAGGFLHGDPWDLTPADAPTTGAGHTGFDLSAEGQLDVDPDLRLGLRASMMRRDGRAIDGGAGGALFDRKNALETIDLTSENRAFLAPGLRLDATLGWSMYRDQSLLDQRRANDLDSYTDTRQHLAIARAVVTERFSDAHRLAVGIEGAFEHLSSERLDGGAGQRVRGSVFAEHGWTIAEAPRLLVVPGARLDADSTFGAYATPQIAVRIDPVPELVLRASFGLGFRAPSFQEQLLRFENPGAGYVVEGNPDLEPETSRSYSARAEWTPVDPLELVLGAYWNDVDDLISTSAAATVPGQPVSYRYANVAQARTRGFDASIGLRFPLGEHAAASAHASWTFLDARDVVLDQPLDGRARHQIAGDALLRLIDLGLELSARGSWWSARPFTLEDGVRESAPYAVLGLRIAETILDELFTLQLGVDNVLDAGDAELAPIPPRVFYAGITGRI